MHLQGEIDQLNNRWKVKHMISVTFQRQTYTNAKPLNWLQNQETVSVPLHHMIVTCTVPWQHMMLYALSSHAFRSQASHMADVEAEK